MRFDVLVSPRECSVVNRDSGVSHGYELTVYPGTRREVWVVAVGKRLEGG